MCITEKQAGSDSKVAALIERVLSVLFVSIMHIIKKERKKGEFRSMILWCNIWSVAEAESIFYMEYDTIVIIYLWIMKWYNISQGNL